MAEPRGADRPPRLLLIGGGTSVGKTTLAKAVAHELGFTRIVSTDTIREVLRAASGPDAPAALNRSSYSKGETGDAVTDWLDACAAVRPGVDAVISRARREGVDLVLEGVHLVPEEGFLHSWNSQGGVAVGMIVTIGHEGTHRERIEQREEHTYRGPTRYLAAFERIRAIQRGIEERAGGANWKSLDSHLEQDSLGRAEQWLTTAWYQRR